MTARVYYLFPAPDDDYAPPRRDRAAAVTAAILQITGDALRARLNGELTAAARVRIQVADLLRDEFADVAQQAASEIRLQDE
jgi:hypothetical protein